MRFPRPRSTDCAVQRPAAGRVLLGVSSSGPRCQLRRGLREATHQVTARWRGRVMLMVSPPASVTAAKHGSRLFKFV